jgi:hypothetical protein
MYTRARVLNIALAGHVEFLQHFAKGEHFRSKRVKVHGRILRPAVGSKGNATCVGQRQETWGHGEKPTGRLVRSMFCTWVRGRGPLPMCFQRSWGTGVSSPGCRVLHFQLSVGHGRCNVGRDVLAHLCSQGLCKAKHR